jgi:hypothetical protein
MIMFNRFGGKIINQTFKSSAILLIVKMYLQRLYLAVATIATCLTAGCGYQVSERAQQNVSNNTEIVSDTNLESRVSTNTSSRSLIDPANIASPLHPMNSANPIGINNPANPASPLNMMRTSR